MTPEAKERPLVICLCGSTRFTGEMLIKQWELTKQGNIVLSWCALPDWYFKTEDKAHIGDQEGVKTIVDEVHKRKIDLSDEVLVINIGGYIGESTRSEVNYARSQGKPVRWLENAGVCTYDYMPCDDTMRFCCTCRRKDNNGSFSID